MNGYDLTRRFFNFSYDTPECKCQHIALFLWIVELNNRLGWKRKFSIPTTDTMESLSIGNRNTYLSALKLLDEWGFIRIHTLAKNQNHASVIEICHVKSEQAEVSALDSALTKQSTGGELGGGTDTELIDKQRNKETKKPIEREGDSRRSVFKKPEVYQIADYFEEYVKDSSYDSSRFAQQFFDHYESKDWKIGKEKMKNWEAAVRTWVNKDPDRYRPKKLEPVKMLEWTDSAGVFHSVPAPKTKMVV